MSAPENGSFVMRHPTQLIGREDDMAAIKERLLEDNVRLLTLTGVAGVGKTRLAIAVAEELQQTFTKVIFVDLSPLTKPAQMLPTITRACDVQESGPGPLVELLARAIGSRHFLLVLDNCEHMLEAIPELSYMLSACPDLKVMATSRETLRLKWEWVFPIPPLQIPDLKRLPSLDGLAAIPAVTLFLQRARARDASFNLTEENARSVAELCVRLDGLPLAIELAASNVNLLRPKDLLDRLSESLNLPGGGARDAPARHQTLRAAIDWSYNLLNSQDQCLFRQLSVFSAGWTLPAAESVCIGEELKKNDVLPLLDRLVSRSLVLAIEQKSGGLRYRFLETIREYARERLQETGTEELLRRRHRDWFLEWAERGEPNLWGPGMPVWLEQLEAEYGNLRTALEWSRVTPEEAAGGLRLWAALSRFWDIRGYVSEGRSTADGLLPLATEHTVARARTLMEACLLAQHQGDWATVKTMAEECRTFALDLGDILDASAALMALGVLAQARDDSQGATALFDEAITLARSNVEQEPRALYMALFWLGQLTCVRGDNQRAETLLEEALTLARRQGDVSFDAVISTWLGRAVLGLGDVRRATDILIEGLHTCQKLGYWEWASFCLDFLGQAAWARQEHQHAICLFGTANEIRVQIGVIRWFEDPDYNRALAAARAEVGEDALLSAQATARNQSLEEMIAWVLSAGEPMARATELTTPSEPSILSAREWEVAGLVANGLSNRRIAEKLVVSKRTVDAHVRHILGKLGFSSRSQLAAWFTTHGKSSTRNR
jgi:non-specific serine/threonine protein kinase